MKFLLSISPSKEMGDCTRPREKKNNSAGIEPTTSEFDQPLALRTEARRKQSGFVNMIQSKLCCMLLAQTCSRLPSLVVQSVRQRLMKSGGRGFVSRPGRRFVLCMYQEANKGNSSDGKTYLSCSERHFGIFVSVECGKLL